ncbi:MAG: aromatic acid/H+ symport family MFS transporter [Neisseriaceae bacterium]|nr:aromatic acid/H+ symport family MFS transporter [Neisseriaceae bacterium]MBP6862149.1 aromatic acid/H+ symport family MFS transporter [Neisseriaceae bacterium]
MTASNHLSAAEPKPSADALNIGPMIDEAKFQKFHWLTIFWSAYIIIFDGYDLAVLGVILPKLMTEWGLSGAQAGLLGSYTLFGMMIGALSLGTLSDKLGKKKVMAGCIIVFSAFTFMCGFATNPTEFGWYRFIAGIGLGGVMPVVTTLTSEYSPKHKRSMMVGLMFSGYSIGGMLAALLGIFMIPTFGWQSIFYVAIFPILLLPLILKQMPEASTFLIQTKQWDRLGALMQKIRPEYRHQPGTTFTSPNTQANDKARIVIGDLFAEGRLLSTVMIWLVFFMLLYVIYGMTSWLPRLMIQAGYPLGSSLSFLFTLHLGTILGAVSSGWFMDRFNGRNVMVTYLALGAVAIGALGFIGNSQAIYGLLVIAGATTIGTQIAMCAFVARFYPSRMSSTGLGWGLGMGRIGAILGPFIGGVLFDLSLTLQQNFLSFALPSLLAALFMLLVNKRLTAS